jgi:hypothetical protein
LLTGGSDPKPIGHVERSQLRVAERSGVLIARTDLRDPRGPVVCFVPRGEDPGRAFEAVARARGAANGSQREPAEAHSSMRVERAALDWVVAQLPSTWREEAQARRTATELRQMLIPTSLPPCPTNRPYKVGSCTVRIEAIASDHWVIVSQAELEWRIRGIPPRSLQVFTPSWMATWAQFCRWASDVAGVLWMHAQEIEQAVAVEDAALSQSTSSNQVCELVSLGSGPQFCIDRFIRERAMAAGRLVGDNRDFNPNAPRNQSRVQFNFNPENSQFDVFINGTTLRVLPGWTITSMPDGYIYRNTTPDSLKPAAAKRFEITRPGGNPNMVEVRYAFTNQVCADSRVVGQVCPDIDGRVRLIKSGGAWTVDTDNSLMDLFPAKQINRYDPGQGGFTPVVTLEPLAGWKSGLLTWASLSAQLNYQAWKTMHDSGGCNPM